MNTSHSCRCHVHDAHKEHSCVHAHCHHYHMKPQSGKLFLVTLLNVLK